MNPNRMQRFLFENKLAHGAFVELSMGLERMLSHRAYSADVGRLVAQVLGAMPLLATHLNFEGRVHLQFQGAGDMKLLVGQIDQQLRLRAMAKATEGLSGPFEELLAGGHLALMIEPHDTRRLPSQALVPILGDSLSAALEGYFAQSEQLPTLIRVASRGDRVCAFMLQRLPLRDAQGTEEDWEHLWHLASTLTEEELLTQPPRVLLGRLFAEETLRLFDAQPLDVSCRCSPDGIARLLLSLGREEVESIVAEQGRVEVTCEFCGRAYRFGPAQVGELFAAAALEPARTRH